MSFPAPFSSAISDVCLQINKCGQAQLIWLTSLIPSLLWNKKRKNLEEK
jgi:hypothetical protein